MDIRDIYRLLGLLLIPVAVGIKYSMADGLLALGCLCALIGWLGVKPK